MPMIAATGMHLPEKLVTNEELFRRFGRKKIEKVFARIGHGARYHSHPDEHAGDHAVAAGRNALKSAGMRPEEIDLLIIATDTPAFLSPSTAAYVQHKLGATGAAAFDVNCACAAFVTAMDIAAKYIETDGQYRNALVIGTYAMSKFLDPQDAVAYPLFGDGAGAVVLSKDAADGGVSRILASRLVADGSFWDYMGIYGGGSAAVASGEMLASGKQHVRILKNFPKTFNRDRWPVLIDETLAKAGLKVPEIDLFLFTQIRKVTIEEVMEHYSLPMARTHCIMDKWGYPVSACIPMALHDAIENGKLRRGQKLVLCSSGGGYAMACMAIRY